MLLAVALAAVFATLPETILGQDRLKTMPGYQEYQKNSKLANGTVKMGSLTVTWKEGGKSFEYNKDGTKYRYDIAAGKAVEIGRRPKTVRRTTTAEST